MTYRQLRDALNELTDEQLDTTATILATNELELYVVSETTLMSELPIKIRQEVEDFLDYDAPLIVI